MKELSILFLSFLGANCQRGFFIPSGAQLTSGLSSPAGPPRTSGGSPSTSSGPPSTARGASILRLRDQQLRDTAATSRDRLKTVEIRPQETRAGQDELLEALLSRTNSAEQPRPPVLSAPQFSPGRSSQLLASLRGPLQQPGPKVVFAPRDQPADSLQQNLPDQPAAQLVSQRQQVTTVPSFTPKCPADDDFLYLIPHPHQCDLYYMCEGGRANRRECEDGYILNLQSAKCVLATSSSECQGRPYRQTPKGSGPCQRSNGDFYTNETCDTYVKCRNNIPNFHQCAQGLIYDPNIRTCAFPDDAMRPGCEAENLLGFRCPNPKLTQEEVQLHRVVLRFGDHDRHAHPEDCRYFFMCLRTGQPRLGGCSEGKVFDRASGVCAEPKDVPGCENYYAGKV